MTCPLCGLAGAAPFASAHNRRFFRCAACGLTFADRAGFPNAEAEEARYRLHENRADDPGYISFLGRVVEQIASDFERGAKGLDYGSGPNPVLAQILRERGFDITVYDRFFAPPKPPAGTRFDFVTCVETAEHFHEPATEFAAIAAMLEPGGMLVVSTELLDDDTRFADWHYVRDFTHVCFYKRETMEWIAGRFGWRAKYPGSNIVVFL